MTHMDGGASKLQLVTIASLPMVASTLELPLLHLVMAWRVRLEFHLTEDRRIPRN